MNKSSYSYVCFHFSYKENDSALDTDSDDIVEVTYEEKEEDNSETIEKIMDYRVSSKKSGLYQLVCIDLTVQTWSYITCYLEDMRF